MAEPIEMVERVARAAHNAKIFVINSDTPDAVRWEDTSERNHYLYYRLANAVIEAMREPTDKMRAARPILSFDFDKVWRAMIDAALGK